MKQIRELDPRNRIDHMTYLPDMEAIDSDVMDQVLAASRAYTPEAFGPADVREALAATTRTPRHFAALLSPAADSMLEEMARLATAETQRWFGNAVTLFTGSVVLAARLWLGDFSLGWEKETLSRVKDCYLGYWFLNAYAMLMLLAPLVDAAIERVPRRLLGSVLVPLGMLVFVWAFGAGVPVLGWFFPASSGIGSYTGLALLATYTVARLCRVFDVARFFTWRRAALAVAALWLCTGVGLGEYASPFAVALSAVLFLVFARVPWPGWVGRAACLLGPSMFAVYLLHCNGVGFGLMRALEDRLVDGRGWPLGAAYLAVAALAFGVCVAIDLPRRLVAWGTRGLWAPLLAWADGWWARCFPDR